MHSYSKSFNSKFLKSKRKDSAINKLNYFESHFFVPDKNIFA